MRDIKEYAAIAGLSEAKKPDQKLLLALKKKLLTIMKKKGLIKASEFIKDAAKEHGDEYIDPLIAYVKFAESKINEMEGDLLHEGQLSEDDYGIYKVRQELSNELKGLANKITANGLGGEYDPDRMNMYSGKEVTKGTKFLAAQVKKVKKMEADLRSNIKWTFKF